MNFLVALLLFWGTILSSSSAKEESKDSKPVSSEIQYIGDDDGYSGKNNIFGGSNRINRFDGLPDSYGRERGLFGAREILRNRFRGSDGNSRSDDQGNDYGNDQSTTGVTNYPYSGIGGQDEEIPNGVFSNPFLGQRRRTYSSSPEYGTTRNGDQLGYGIPYLGGSYTPGYRPQSGSYPFSPGLLPGGSQGYIYPVGGVGLRQPNGVFGADSGNQYGVYPGTLRNVPSSYLPVNGANDIYRGSSGGYGPELYGFRRYPELLYPGSGLEYARLNDAASHGNRRDESVRQKPARVPYPETSSSTRSPRGVSEQKTKALRTEDP